MLEDLVILLSALMLICLFTLYKKGVKLTMGIAAVISMIWVLSSGLYNYKNLNMVVAGINLFSFLAWTLGLTLFKMLCDKLDDLIKNKWALWIGLILFWFGGMMLIEYIGYDLMTIQLSSNYPGLFGLPIMHMPWWGQLYYMAIGPIFIFMTKRIKL